MSKAVPISALNNYAEVLADVHAGSPLFLEHNGTKRYVIVDIEEYNEMKATVKLISELERGRMSIRRQSSISLDEAANIVLQRDRD